MVYARLFDFAVAAIYVGRNNYFLLRIFSTARRHVPKRGRCLLLPEWTSAAPAYPKRTRQQWQEDLRYGKEQFDALRARGPLKREGHPDALVTHKSWDKIRNGNIPEKYDMLPDVPDIYATGKHHIQPRLKERMDGFDRFHWFQKNNKGIQIGENQYGRTLYNVNSDVRQYLIEHPEVARRLGIDIKQL